MIVHKYVKKPLRKGDVGIEIEVEALKALPVFQAKKNSGGWKAKAEASLRGYAMEYVTEGPINVDEDKKDKIAKLIADIKPSDPVDDSDRTSVHVHVNIGSYTPVQLWSSVCAYWLLDDLLMKYCGGAERESNLFCRRLTDAEGVLYIAKKDTRGLLPFKEFIGEYGDRVRYASQNLKAITDFGSLEFRGMRGTMDAEVIDTWSTELFNLCRNAKHIGDPGELLDTFGRIDKRHFLGLLFGGAFVDKLTSIPNWDRLLDHNVGALCGFAYSIPDWYSWQAKLESNWKEDKPLSYKGIPLDTTLTSAQVEKAMQIGLFVQWDDDDNPYVDSNQKIGNHPPEHFWAGADAPMYINAAVNQNVNVQLMGHNAGPVLYDEVPQ